jgi:hypothetical protein
VCGGGGDFNNNLRKVSRQIERAISPLRKVSRQIRVAGGGDGPRGRNARWCPRGRNMLLAAATHVSRAILAIITYVRTSYFKGTSQISEVLWKYFGSEDVAKLIFT